MSNIVNGWSFPEEADPPEADSGEWHRIKTGGEEVWVVGHDILIDVAHQIGLNDIETEIAHAGHGLNDVPYVAVRAEVDIEGYPTVNALGSIDETGNSLADMVSTAETKAIKRAIKRALGVTNPGAETEDPDARGETTGKRTTETSQGGSISHDPETGEVEVDPPQEDPDPAGGDSDDGIGDF